MVQPMLLSFAGEDQYMGAFLPGLKKGVKKYGKYGLLLNPLTAAAYGAYGAKKALIRHKRRKAMHGEDVLGLTPSYYYGDDDAVYFGKGKVGFSRTKVGKFFKKAGKFTSPFTTSIAKSILPSSVVNAFAKIDPTRGKVNMAAVSQAQNILKKSSGLSIPTESEIKREAAMKTLTNPMVLGIAGAGILALLLMRKR